MELPHILVFYPALFAFVITTKAQLVPSPSGTVNPGYDYLDVLRGVYNPGSTKNPSPMKRECSSMKPCQAGQGFCRNDMECAMGLKCASNSCQGMDYPMMSKCSAGGCGFGQQCSSNYDCEFGLACESGLCPGDIDVCSCSRCPPVQKMGSLRKCCAVPRYSKLFVPHSMGKGWVFLPNGNYTSSSKCSSIPVIPPLFGTQNAAVVDGEITVCGEAMWPRTLCQRLDKKDNKWVETKELPDSYYRFSTVLTPSGWWAAGGMVPRADGGGSIPQTKTYLFNSTRKEWSTGPTMNIARYAHCLARLNDTHYFICGGQAVTENRFVQDAWIYNWPGNSWTQVSSKPTITMGVGRCSRYTDSKGGRHVLVLVHPATCKGRGCIESFNVNTLQWSLLPPLPEYIGPDRGVFVQSGADFYLYDFDTANNMALRFNEDSWTFSIMDRHHLTWLAVAIPINDDVLHGC